MLERLSLSCYWKFLIIPCFVLFLLYVFPAGLTGCCCLTCWRRWLWRKTQNLFFFGGLFLPAGIQIRSNAFLQIPYQKLVCDSLLYAQKKTLFCAFPAGLTGCCCLTCWRRWLWRRSVSWSQPAPGSSPSASTSSPTSTTSRTSASSPTRYGIVEAGSGPC